jgi:hypothetical protein
MIEDDPFNEMIPISMVSSETAIRVIDYVLQAPAVLSRP